MSLDHDARHLYLDLMKRCLTSRIYADDPLADYVPYRRKPDTPTWKRTVIAALESLLMRHSLRLVERHTVPWQNYARLSGDKLRELREKELYFGARGHTLIGIKRLDNIQFCVQRVLDDRIAGDLIETGVWRGGACIFMRAILKANGDTSRTVWLADSFQGLPSPNASEYPADAGDKHHDWSDYFAVSRAKVEDNFRQYGLLDGQVRFLEGWFKDTLPGAPVSQLAVLRLDGDMYEATIQSLQYLYDKVSPGGFVIIDDYYLPACAKAVHDFRGALGIAEDIEDIDGRGVFWRRLR